MTKKLVIIAATLLLATILIAGCIDAPMTKTIRYDMYSLERGMTTSGNFVLGSGSVNGVPSYVYYIQVPNDGYKLKTVVSSKCTLYQNENTTPYITANYTRDVMILFRDTVDHLHGDVGDNYVILDTGENGTRKYDWFMLDGEVEIHIPPNSIVREYKP